MMRTVVETCRRERDRTRQAEHSISADVARLSVQLAIEREARRQAENAFEEKLLTRPFDREELASSPKKNETAEENTRIRKKNLTETNADKDRYRRERDKAPCAERFVGAGVSMPSDQLARERMVRQKAQNERAEAQLA